MSAEWAPARLAVGVAGCCSSSELPVPRSSHHRDSCYTRTARGHRPCGRRQLTINALPPGRAGRGLGHRHSTSLRTLHIPTPALAQVGSTTVVTYFSTAAFGGREKVGEVRVAGGRPQAIEAHVTKCRGRKCGVCRGDEKCGGEAAGQTTVEEAERRRFVASDARHFPAAHRAARPSSRCQQTDAWAFGVMGGGVTLTVAELLHARLEHRNGGRRHGHATRNYTAARFLRRRRPLGFSLASPPTGPGAPLNVAKENACFVHPLFFPARTFGV